MNSGRRSDRPAARGHGRRAAHAASVAAALFLAVGLAASPVLAAARAPSGDLLARPAAAAAEQPAPPPVREDDSDALPGVALAQTLATTTGIAITPLFGVSAVGAWHYYQTDPAARAELPWYAARWFWLPGMIVALLLVFKDPILGLVPGAKKPLDAIDVVENKLSAVLATPAVVAMAAAAFAAAAPLAENFGEPVAAAGVGVVGGVFETALQAVGLTFGAAVFLVAFVVVWLAFHAINVLILLSPFGPLDLALRSVKLGVLAVLGGATLFHPYLGLLVALLIVAMSIPLAGWSFRFMVFGWVMATDFLLGRHRKVRDDAAGIAVFAAERVGPARVRTYGRVTAAGGALRFGYRPWGVLPRREVELPAEGVHVGRGLVGPCLVLRQADGDAETVFRLPPRYRSHEAAVAVALDLGEVEELPLRRGLGAIAGWLREMAGRGGAAVTRLVG